MTEKKVSQIDSADLRRRAVERLGDNARASHPPGTGDESLRLLIAEDEPTTREFLALLLKRLKYDLDFAEDGLMVVKMWENGDYDLVLMDVQMPRLDGFEATKAIRKKELERGGHTPIVAMTAHARKEDEESCLAAGMDAFVSKPIDFKKCLELIGQLIKQKSILNSTLRDRLGQ